MVVGSKTRNFDNSYAWDITVCTSGTRPTAYEGRLIYETDTDKVMKCTNPVGPVWEEVGGGAGVTDHGALTGLADDDHTQYLLVNGSRDMTGSLDMDNNSIIDINELRFNASDPGIKFDTGDFIWFDTSEDRIYFEIASDNICYVRSTGIHPDNNDTYYLGSGSSYWKALYATSLVVDAGAYITSDISANMELHVATGKTVKIVVG